MPRALVSLILLSLLGACATGSSTVNTDPSSTHTDVDYMTGVTSDYSVRLDDLPARDALGSETAMIEGLIAGDRQLHVTVALFRKGPHFTMDLVVNNRGEEALRLQREDIKLLDSEGNWFSPEKDWQGAEVHGLRGKSQRRTSTFLYEDAGLAYSDLTDPAAGLATSSPSAGKGATREQALRPKRLPAGASTVDLDWKREDPELPQTLEVPAGEGRVYWAYFAAEGAPSFPLTAFVTVEGRHMIFNFSE